MKVAIPKTKSFVPTKRMMLPTNTFGHFCPIAAIGGIARFDLLFVTFQWLQNPFDVVFSVFDYRNFSNNGSICFICPLLPLNVPSCQHCVTGRI